MRTEPGGCTCVSTDSAELLPVPSLPSSLLPMHHSEPSFITAHSDVVSKSAAIASTVPEVNFGPTVQFTLPAESSQHRASAPGPGGPKRKPSTTVPAVPIGTPGGPRLHSSPADVTLQLLRPFETR